MSGVRYVSFLSQLPFENRLSLYIKTDKPCSLVTNKIVGNRLGSFPKNYISEEKQFLDIWPPFSIQALRKWTISFRGTNSTIFWTWKCSLLLSYPTLFCLFSSFLFSSLFLSIPFFFFFKVILFSPFILELSGCR